MLVLGALALLAACGSPTVSAQDPTEWPIHSMERPQPPIVEPGTALDPVAPPSDAIVLFDGGLSAWRSADGGAAAWTVRDGYVEVAAGAGNIRTADAFGDVQLHVEWAAPEEVVGEGQGRGNSGVFLMGRYELQILDSWGNPTYPDGQAAALYGFSPPLVNASRPPGEWQSYDVVFRAPRFDEAGGLARPARLTVFHNGVLVQDGVEPPGPTAHGSRPPYEAHEPRLPLELQDHGNPVRFRNIWIRKLDGGER